MQTSWMWSSEIDLFGARPFPEKSKISKIRLLKILFARVRILLLHTAPTIFLSGLHTEAGLDNKKINGEL